MQNITKTIIITILILLLTNCSSIFTASLTGTLKNRADYLENADSGNIDNAMIYLYQDKALRDSDYNSWSDTRRNWYASTESEDGTFTFNGIIWENFFPEYGKSGDRMEIFLLIYHPDYGYVKNPAPIMISSDVSNSIAPILIDDILAESSIEGYVRNYSEVEELEGDGLAGVEVAVYIKDLEGNFKTEAADVFNTDGDGFYQGDITFYETEEGTESILLTYTLDGYETNSTIDANILTDKDVDSDGIATDPYFQTTVTEDVTNILPDISLKEVIEYANATIEGSVQRWRPEASQTERPSINGVNISLWVADYWEYEDDETTIDTSSIIYPEEPSYNVVTNADGEYNLEIEYFIRGENAPITIGYNLEGYLLDSSIDSDIEVDDMDKNGEDEALFKDITVTPDVINNINTIDMKQINFTTSLSGILYDISDGDGKSNRTVNLSFTIDGVNYLYSTVSETISINNSTAEKGHYSFDSIEWEDTSYTTDESSLDITISVDDEITSPNPSTLTISSGKENTYHLEIE